LTTHLDRLTFRPAAFLFSCCSFGARGREKRSAGLSLLVLFSSFSWHRIWCRRFWGSIIRKTGGLINQYRTGQAQRSGKRRYFIFQEAFLTSLCFLCYWFSLGDEGMHHLTHISLVGTSRWCFGLGLWLRSGCWYGVAHDTG